MTIPVVDLVRTGTATGAAGSEVTGDAANNHTFTNDGRVCLLARNSAGTATRNVTNVIAQNSIDGQTVTNPTVAVPVNSAKVIGPFPPALYNPPTDPGQCYINVDHADLKLQAFRIP